MRDRGGSTALIGKTNKTNNKQMKNKLMKTIFGFSLISTALILGFASTASAAILYRQLQVGMSGSDVSALQTFLAKDVTIYPQGLVTGYFGFLTKAAVSNFQSRNGISPVGRVGPITLAAINSQMGGGIGDANAPIISNVSLTVGTNSATITWNTNEASRSKVYYQTSFPTMIEASETTQATISGTTSADGNLVTSHTVNISGLQSGTTYYYVVESIDGNGNMSIVWPVTLRTQ